MSLDLACLGSTRTIIVQDFYFYRALRQQQDVVMNISVLEYSSHGKTYEVERKRVFSISELRRGDHIAFDRKLYWHHAIVEYIDRKNGKIGLIHYNKTPEGYIQDIFSPPKRRGKACVVQETYEFKKEPVYLMKHIHGRCLDPDIVVLIAKVRVGNDKYHLVYNNCEHFAMSCKTGVAASYQVQKVMEHLLPLTLSFPIFVYKTLLEDLERLFVAFYPLPTVTKRILGTLSTDNKRDEDESGRIRKLFQPLATEPEMDEAICTLLRVLES